MTNDRGGLQLESRDGALVVAGEIDAHNCTALAVALTEARGGDLRVELSGVTFIDSSGLRVLVEHHHRLAAQGDELRIVRPSRPVQRLFEITGLDGQFHVEAS